MDRYFGYPILSLVLLSLLLASVNRACAADRTIYYLLPSFYDEWQTQSQKIIEAVFAKRNYRVISLDASESQDVQNRQFNDLIGLLPPAIILNTVKDDKVDRDSIKRAIRLGIRVLIFDGAVGVRVNFNSSTDAPDMGRQAGKEAIRLLKQAGKNRGRILEILGDPYDSWSFEVQTEFEKEVVKSAPDIQIISRAAADWYGGNAYKIAASQLEEGQNVDLIYAHSGDLANSAIDVIRKKAKDNKKDNKPILVISSNGAPVGLKNIKDGRQQIEIEQPLYAQAYGLGLFLDGEMTCPIGQTECNCDVLGARATLGIDRENGLTLKLKGRVIDLPHVDDKQFWGNLILPDFPRKWVCMPPRDAPPNSP